MPIKGIRSCGIEAPSNLAPHLLPVRKEVLPVRKAVLPVRKAVLPVHKEELPVRKELLPVRKEVLPVRKEVLPVRKGVLPLDNCTCLPFGAGFRAMPGVATSAMAENHTNTDSIGLQLQVACWYEQEELPEA